MRDEVLSYVVGPGRSDGTAVVKLVGPLTLSNLFDLQTELRALKVPLTIFDLSESEYMDSAGLGVLMNFYVSAEKNGRRMALAGVNYRIDALLEVTHVKGLLRAFATVDEAEG